MERSGLCRICGRVARPAFTCNMCGATVCMWCFERGHGLCVNCGEKGKQL
jgi:hypothetical protein